MDCFITHYNPTFPPWQKTWQLYPLFSLKEIQLG